MVRASFACGIAVMLAGCGDAPLGPEATGVAVTSVEVDPVPFVQDSVVMTVTATNVSLDTIVVNGATFGLDLEVRNSNGQVVWRRYDNLSFILIDDRTPFAPGEERTATAAWDLRTGIGVRVPPGRYSLTGLVRNGPYAELARTPTFGIRVVK